MCVISSNRKVGKNSVFQCIPKDAEQLEFEIAMNENMIWEDKGPIGSTSLTTLQKGIIKVVEKLYNGNVAESSGTPVKAKQIIEAIQQDTELTEEAGRKEPYTKADINKTLDRMSEPDRHLIMKTKRGVYTPSVF